MRTKELIFEFNQMIEDIKAAETETYRATYYGMARGFITAIYRLGRIDSSEKERLHGLAREAYRMEK